MEALFLGIDIGTTAVKTAVFNDQGLELRVVGKDMQPDYSPSGEVTLNMDELWHCVSKLINETVAEIDSIGKISAIGITAMGDGLWLLDKNGKPTTDAVLWLDGRAVNYINAWDDAGLLRSSGRVVFSGSPLALAAWSIDSAPDIIKGSAKLLFCKDWIKYCLTGEIVTDFTDLSDASLLNVRSSKYSKELLDLFGAGVIDGLLPPMKPCTEVIGRVSDAAARITGLPAGIPVVNGAIDVVSSAIGAGVLNSQYACSVIGTTIYNEMVIDSLDGLNLDEKDAPSLINYYGQDKWLLTMGTMLGTPNLDWFIREFYLKAGEKKDFSAIELQLEKIGPGAGGVIYHPYLGQGGERAPFVKASAAAQFFGIKSHHTREHLLRSVYEGIAYSMKDCYKNFPLELKGIRLVGGGSSSEFWCDIFANCLGMPAEVTVGNQIGALGAAVIAAVGTGYFNGFEEAISQMVKVKQSYEPDPIKVSVYEENYAIYRQLYLGNWHLWDQRSALWNISKEGMK